MHTSFNIPIRVRAVVLQTVCNVFVFYVTSINKINIMCLNDISECTSSDLEIVSKLKIVNRHQGVLSILRNLTISQRFYMGRLEEMFNRGSFKCSAMYKVYKFWSL